METEQRAVERLTFLEATQELFEHANFVLAKEVEIAVHDGCGELARRWVCFGGELARARKALDQVLEEHRRCAEQLAALRALTVGAR